MPRGTLLDTVGNLGSEKAMKYFEYVEAIHTSAPFGKTERRGHIDFYPNGGSNQPCTCDNACPDIDCNSSWHQKNDHKRAPAYFEKSIPGTGMVSVPDAPRQVDGRLLVLVQGSARGRQPPRISRGGLGRPQAPPAFRAPSPETPVNFSGFLFR